MTIPDDWAPDACTLPTSERPLRIAEFGDLFSWVSRWERVRETQLDLTLTTDIESEARDLARRENECCSFFSFDFTSTGNELVMHIEVPPSQVQILDAIERAQSQ